LIIFPKTNKKLLRCHFLLCIESNPRLRSSKWRRFKIFNCALSTEKKTLTLL